MDNPVACFAWAFAISAALWAFGIWVVALLIH